MLYKLQCFLIGKAYNLQFYCVASNEIIVICIIYILIALNIFHLIAILSIPNCSSFKCSLYSFMFRLIHFCSATLAFMYVTVLYFVFYLVVVCVL